MERIAELLTAYDVARMLRLGRSTIYDLASRGALPRIVISEGRRRPIVRFDREAIQRWIQERSRREDSAA